MTRTHRSLSVENMPECQEGKGITYSYCILKRFPNFFFWIPLNPNPASTYQVWDNTCVQAGQLRQNLKYNQYINKVNVGLLWLRLGMEAEVKGSAFSSPSHFSAGDSHEFQTSLGYTVRPCLLKKKKKITSIVSSFEPFPNSEILHVAWKQIVAVALG